MQARVWRSASGLMEEDQDGPAVSLAGTETCGSESILILLIMVNVYHCHSDLFYGKGHATSVLGHNSVFNVGRVVRCRIWRDPCQSWSGLPHGRAGIMRSRIEGH